MRLILSRHGNTFGPGDKPVWIGRRTNLPLVASGEAQARLLGRALVENGVVLRRIYSGPLSRTRRYAEIAAEEAGSLLTPVIDDRLAEIDYGAWEGLTNQEIADGPQADALEKWERRSLWPDAAGWSPDEDVVAKGIADFANGLAAAHAPDEVALVVSSNGVMRYFLRLSPDDFEKSVAQGVAKTATGNVCLLDLKQNRVVVQLWNAPPEEAMRRL